MKSYHVLILFFTYLMGYIHLIPIEIMVVIVMSLYMGFIGWEVIMNTDCIIPDELITMLEDKQEEEEEEKLLINETENTQIQWHRW